MKKVVWFLGALLLLSFAFPNGIPVKPVTPAVTPAGPVVTDPAIVKLLAEADPADKRRVAGIYSGMKSVLERDVARPEAEKLLSTTDKFAQWHGLTLVAAVEKVGKYPGLDVAINDVFKKQLGTDDTLPLNQETANKLLTACEIVANSAESK
jgi:hypothetical protein